MLFGWIPVCKCLRISFQVWSIRVIKCHKWNRGPYLISHGPLNRWGRYCTMYVSQRRASSEVAHISGYRGSHFQMLCHIIECAGILRYLSYEPNTLGPFTLAKTKLQKTWVFCCTVYTARKTHNIRVFWHKKRMREKPRISYCCFDKWPVRMRDFSLPLTVHV